MISCRGEEGAKREREEKLEKELERGRAHETFSRTNSLFLLSYRLCLL